jgi:exodeoxyribonuclease VII small subunit
MAQRKARKKPSFEESLSELEQLVGRMESGELSLEDSLEEFENGMQLSNQCQSMLEEAEQRVQILCGKETLQDFNTHSDDR